MEYERNAGFQIGKFGAMGDLAEGGAIKRKFPILDCQCWQRTLHWCSGPGGTAGWGGGGWGGLVGYSLGDWPMLLGLCCV